MDVLCLEVERMKEKLYKKLLGRRQDLDSVILTEQSRPHSINPHNNETPIQAPFRRLTSPIVHYNPQESHRYKELSTDRSMHHCTDR